jgi:hypothetical protein
MGYYHNYIVSCVPIESLLPFSGSIGTCQVIPTQPICKRLLLRLLSLQEKFDESGAHLLDYRASIELGTATFLPASIFTLVRLLGV